MLVLGIKKPISPVVVGSVIAMFVAGLLYFGFRSVNTSNIHSYDEGTPEQRAALSHAFGPGGKAPPPKP